MTVTQYIGARYQPIFADPAEWNSTRTYEPLTIVLNEGNSYTSRQYVPAGVELSNKDYWLETGNYNAQVEQYRAEVMTFSDRINENTKIVNENTALINMESDRAKEVEEKLEANITAENSRAVTAENKLESSITAENSRAVTAENKLESSITATRKDINSFLHFTTYSHKNITVEPNSNFVESIQYTSMPDYEEGFGRGFLAGYTTGTYKLSITVLHLWQDRLDITLRNNTNETVTANIDVEIVFIKPLS